MNFQQLSSDDASCTDVLKCVFSLGDPEIELFRILDSEGPLRSDQLAEASGRNPSTVYRSLQRMVSCGIVIRDNRIIEGGGYYYLYRAKGRTQLKKELKSCMEQMMRRVDELLEGLEEGF